MNSTYCDDCGKSMSVTENTVTIRRGPFSEEICFDCAVNRREINMSKVGDLIRNIREAERSAEKSNLVFKRKEAGE